MRQIKKPQHSRYAPEESSSSSSQSSEEMQQEEELLDAELQKIQQQLKNMPYELILKQRQALTAKQDQPHTAPTKTPKIKKIAKKKVVEETKHEKNEAAEVSIHGKQRRKFVQVFAPKRKKNIDPRFQSFAGNYNPDLAMKSYNFIPKLQQAEINELKSKLKGKTKRHKLNPHQRQVLTNEYNRVTSDYKRGELIQLEKQTKREMREKAGEDFHVKKNVFRQEFQKKKLEGMSEADRERKLKEKDTQVRRNQMNERRKALHMNPRRTSD